MDYALLWLGSLAATLFFMAAGLGAAASLPARRKRLLVAGGVFLLLLSPGLLALILSAAAQFSYGYPGSWFGYILSWNLHLWAGTTLAVWGAFRAREGAPAGKSWAFRRLLLGGGVFAALTAMTFWAIDDGVRGRIQTLRAEAGAMALAAAAPRVPDSENAAPLYQEAFESLMALRDKPPVSEEWLEKWLDKGPELAELNGADLQGLLAASAGDLALLRRAASMPGCHFVRNTGNLYAILLPELAAFRMGSQWLALEARAAAARGDLALAFGNAAAISRMAVHVSQEPFVISALVGIALEGQAALLVDALLSTAQPARRDLAALEALPPVSYRMQMQRALRAEMASGLEILALLSGSGGSLPDLESEAGPALGGIAPLWRVFLFESELNHYRKAMQEYVNWLSLPYPEARPQVEAARGKIEAKRTITGRILLPALWRLFESVPRADASRRLARAAAAVAAFRDGEGRYPERLEELRPKYAERIPQDPFDGRPLRLARKGTGVVVYSVGLNGKDDGGDLSNDPSTGTPLDLGIRVGPAK